MAKILLDDSKDTTLQALAILEHDTGEDVSFVWKHPGLDAELSKIIISRSFILTSKQPSFSKFKDKWIYISSAQGQGRVKTFALVLLASEFNPEKYLSLLSLLSSLYSFSPSPPPLLQVFLDVFTKAKYEGVGGKFSSKEFDTSKEHLLASSLFDIVKSFEDSAWLLWSALLMKKRVCVLAEDPSSLLRFIRALPLFVIHRMDWSLLRPLVTFHHEAELEDLRSAGVYVAGFVDPKIRQREDLWDLLVDLPKQSIQPAGAAAEDFVQNRFHSDLTSFLSKALQTEGIDNPKIIKAFKVKTAELLQKLASLKQSGSEGSISFSLLSSLQLPPNTHNFLYGVAAAEGMTKVGAA